MPPHSESGLSDIVRDWKIETEVYAEYIKHIFYESGSSARERHIRKEEKWERQKRLGEGGYGTVYLEKCVQGDKQEKLRAVKMIKSQDFKYSRELDAIIKFSHHKYAHCFVQSFGWFEIDESIFIAMEYYEMGDLQRYLTKPLPEPEARRITFQVLEGLEFMHENGFVHRDIKPGNTLVVTAGPEWFVKIADFGISKRRQPGVTTVRTKQIGTHGFTAPELLNFKSENTASSYTYSVDMWSLGAMAYLMLTNTVPFENLGDLYEYAYKSSSFPSVSLQKHDVSEEGREFIMQLMSSKSGDRPTAPTAKSHGWLLCADTPTDEAVQQR
ncbi:protein kinase-like protein [Trichoderma asperelloides]|nr:protein kinase-like protein [Trichoderma asperelloides]